MKTLTTALALTALSTTFAASAADLQLHVFSHANKAMVTVTKDGQAVSGYPVHVDGATALTQSGDLKTADNGSISVSNKGNQPHAVTFAVEDNDGHTIVAKRFLGRDS
ncbi:MULTISPECIES: hypothetical protein [Vibrio]|uniref:Uncharacterized protein n=2 Tax=Vibrio TaxID=662 RepID=A0A7X4LJH4_9VIBR|nr:MULTISPECIES: hypothetical protein [Vibrio]MBF9003373.1 hypothetical protein [Vibrio nitrifigilis]MZI93138.1 hypothetical protein [Vibrio eleionomae]